jgi:hypothetical protein
MHIASLVPLLCSLLLIAAACEDHGLSPVSATETPGFSGTIRMRSAWPPADSVRDLRIAAFRNYPPKDILTEIIAGSAVFSDELPYGENLIEYRVQSETLSGTFAYVVVAQNYGPDPFKQWRAVGVYTVTGNVQSPSPIDLGTGRFLRDIDVEVDFLNLPPQPF